MSEKRDARTIALADHDDEQAALQAIVDGLGEELRDRFATITTIQMGA